MSDKKKIYDTLNEEQKGVFERLINGENIFITGNAGTGKSYLVKAFSEWCVDNKYNLVKTAPTGIAALEIGGSTLHSQFRFKRGVDFTAATKSPDWLTATDTLVIEEVSMLRMDYFDKVMSYVNLENQRRIKKNVRVLQLVLCGDFFQLPPVIPQSDIPLLREHYGTDIGGGYAFQSKYWKKLNIKMAYLKTVVRQQDINFCNVLDACKYGNSNFIGYLMQNCSRNEFPDDIWVCGKNATVDARNEEGLAKLKTAVMTNVAKYEGEATEQDGLCDKFFKYKIGAKVVMTVNDSVGRFKNGSMGVIEKVKMNGIICVRMLHDNKLVDVDKHIFQKTEYVLDKKTLSQKVVGTAEQYPMKLGYAVTIHKSQGQTYERMNLEPEIFAVGQLYVALSRCKSMNGIYINRPLNPYMVKTSGEVIDFYRNPEEYSFFANDNEYVNITVPARYEQEVINFINKLEKDETAKDKAMADAYSELVAERTIESKNLSRLKSIVKNVLSKKPKEKISESGEQLSFF